MRSEFIFIPKSYSYSISLNSSLEHYLVLSFRLQILESIAQQGWCEHIPSLLMLPDHDSREKILHAMEFLMLDHCHIPFRFHASDILHQLNSEYQLLAQEEMSEANGDGYFVGLQALTMKILNHLASAHAHDDLWSLCVPMYIVFSMSVQWFVFFIKLVFDFGDCYQCECFWSLCLHIIHDVFLMQRILQPMVGHHYGWTEMWKLFINGSQKIKWVILTVYASVADCMLCELIVNG